MVETAILEMIQHYDIHIILYNIYLHIHILKYMEQEYNLLLAFLSLELAEEVFSNLFKIRELTRGGSYL